MTEIAQQVGISVTSKIAELLVEPTISQFGYLFCFKSIVDELEAEEKRLKLAMTRVKNQVNLARNNAEEIENDVEKWMADTATAMEEVQRLKDEIQQDKRCFNKCCPNCLWRYCLSKKVAKKTMVLEELGKKGIFTMVSHPAPPLDIEFLPSKYFTPSKASGKAFNQIMDALKDDNIRMIGLYGMGGVGKTTLAQEVANKVKELMLFEEVVLAVVSHNQVFSKIQDQIADKLGVKFDERSEQGRANHLARRLQDGRKKLVILDDVWKNLELKDIGILFLNDQKNCKILLTTRLQQVCTDMDCQKMIHLDVLNEDEAWALFKKNAGLCDDQKDSDKVAMEVAKECKGLPIAIVTVGRALKEKEARREWQVALGKLRESRLTEIRGIDKDNNAYACLKFSFEKLHREESRLCLILCSLFPEGFEIFVDHLVGYALGLGLYKDAQTLENTRNEVLEAIADLQNSCMLLETEKEGYVKVHEMVRSFTLWMGSQVEEVFMVKAYTKLSEWQRDQKSKDYEVVPFMNGDANVFPDGLVCPKLELLLVSGKACDCSEVDYDFFKEMKQVKVLSLFESSSSLQSLKFLTNLQVLELVHCKFKDNFGPTMMMLKRLQILRCWGLDIEELPNEVAELENLKVLDLRGCEKLQKISFGIIYKLCMLEELYLGIHSFSKWESNEVINEETRNASRSELNLLPHLAILWLRVKDTEQIPGDFMFPKLSGYSIHVDCPCHNVSTRMIGHPKPNQICVAGSELNACKKLLENVCELKLRAINKCNLMPDVDASGLNDLISLEVCNSEMECLVDAKLWQQQEVQPMIGLSNLKKLCVTNTNIKEICNGQPPQGFLKRLEDFYIYSCNEIITAFPEIKLRQTLQILQVIEIDNCDGLQEVFQLQAEKNDDIGGGERPVGVKGKTKEEEKKASLLSCLTRMTLNTLPNLRYIWKGTTHHVSLKSLKFLYLWKCNDLKSIFSSSLARSLLHLQALHIGECRHLKHVIEMEEETSLSTRKAVVDNDFKLPNLIAINILGCSSLEYVFPVSVTAQGLPHLEEMQLLYNDELKSVFENETTRNTSTTATVDLQQQQQFIFPSLKNLNVIGCPNMITNVYYHIRQSNKLTVEDGVEKKYVERKPQVVHVLNLPNILSSQGRCLFIRACLCEKLSNK